MPLKVVMLVPYDLQYQPFSIRSIRFAEELTRRGHLVTVFHRPLPPHKRSSNEPVHALPAHIALESMRGPLPSIRPRNWSAVSRAIAQADVVHFQKSLPASMLPAVVLARAYDKPLHQDWDDYEFWFWARAARDGYAGLGPVDRAVRTSRAWLAAGLTGAAEWAIPKLVDTIGGASAELRRQSLALGASPGAIFPARVGVDAARFGLAFRDEALRAALGLTGPTVVFSGSVDLHSELQFMVDALKHLTQKLPAAQCLVLGGGFGHKRLQQLLAGSGLGKAVVLSQGFVPFADMPRHLASVEAAALPFRDTRVNRAKSSLTLLECMATGLAVVTHDVGDVKWMLGDAGVLAPPDDPIAFGESLVQVLSDPKLRTQLGTRARERAASQFSWEGSVDYLEAAYYAAIERHRARGPAAHS